VTVPLDASDAPSLVRSPPAASAAKQCGDSTVTLACHGANNGSSTDGCVSRLPGFVDAVSVRALYRKVPLDWETVRARAECSNGGGISD